MTKEVPSSHQRSATWHLSTFSMLSEGLSPAQICQRLSIPKSTLQHYLTSWKRAGIIRKLGYGTWEVLTKEVPKEVPQSHQVPRSRMPIAISASPSKTNQIRGHGFMFKVRLPPYLTNWDKRAQVLEKLGIKFRTLDRQHSQIHSLMFKDRKVWLSNSSIIIYEPASYLSDSAEGSRNHAVSNLQSLLTSLERLLHTSFRIHGDYQFKVSRSHYAMMKNELARQYDQEGKKLHIYNSDGLWFLIDNSFNLHEAETVHPKTSLDDMDGHVKPFFNELKDVEFLPKDVLKSLALLTQIQGQQNQNIGQLTQNLNQDVKNLSDYAIHLKAHVESVQELGRGVRALTEVVKKLDAKNSKQSDDEIDKRGF